MTTTEAGVGALIAPLPYAVAICANPDAIPETRRRIHERFCACAGELATCPASKEVAA